jgi:hypothetical protein
MRRRLYALVALLAVPVGLPVLLLFGHIQAEWALAFGRASIVSATVAGSRPSLQYSRTCSSMTRIDVTWPAPDGTNPGHFTVCDPEARQYPVGKVIQVAVLPGDSSVIVGADRASAIFGVVLESLVLLFFLLMLALAVRWWLVLRTAATGWRSAPWLPAEARQGIGSHGKRQPIVVFFDPETGPDAMDLLVEPRRDGAQLEAGDRVWVIPTGRSLFDRRLAAPYAVVRAGDWAMFWGMGKPMP